MSEKFTIFEKINCLLILLFDLTTMYSYHLKNGKYHNFALKLKIIPKCLIWLVVNCF